MAAVIINLIPELARVSSEKRKQSAKTAGGKGGVGYIIKNNKILLAVIIGAVGIIGVESAVGGYMALRMAGGSSKMKSLQQKYDQQLALYNEIQTMKGKLVGLDEEHGKLRTMVEERHLWTRILNDISDVIPEGLQLTLVRFMGQEKEGMPHLLIKGLLLDQTSAQDVQRYIDGLKGAPYFMSVFRDVILLAIHADKEGGKVFSLKCLLKKEEKAQPKKTKGPSPEERARALEVFRKKHNVQ